MNQPIKVLFASGSEDLIPIAIEHMQKLFPELPLVVVSEFPVSGARWIPYPVARGFWENWALFRWHFRDQRIRLSAVILQPRTPYRRMRLIAFLIAPRMFLAFNENLDHFMLRPQSLATILRHILWRTKLEILTTCVRSWRWLTHPRAFRRSLPVFWARAAGAILTALKAVLPVRRRASLPAETRPPGISVVIPSRNGKDLLATSLPAAVRQIGGEVIVIDHYCPANAQLAGGN